MGDKRGCFKVGCLGCLAVVGVGVLCLVLVGIGVAVTANREVRVEPIDSVHEPPPFESSQLPHDSVAPLAEAMPETRAGDPRLAEPGRIVLDVSLCTFSLEPGSPGEPLRLDGEYDAGAVAVSEKWESYGEIGWVYRLDMKKRGLPFFIHHEESTCRLTLTVPRGTPFALEGKLGVGESLLDLGGLYVLDVDLETGIGEHEVSFSQPPVRPLGRLRVHGSIGELRVEGVGNASPAEVEIGHSLGDVVVDLGGEWRNDAAVSVSCGIGACRLKLPHDAGIEVVKTSMSLGESNFSELQRRPPQAGLPTLRLSLSGTVGEFIID